MRMVEVDSRASKRWIDAMSVCLNQITIMTVVWFNNFMIWFDFLWFCVAGAERMGE